MSSSQPGVDGRVVRLGLAVHPGDRRARAGCRGTAAAAPPPDPLERVVRVVRARSARRRSPPTAPPRAAGARCGGCPRLVRCLRGVGPAVQLEVQLARPHRRAPGTRLRARSKKSRGRVDRDRRRALERAGARAPRPSSRASARRRRRRSRTAAATRSSHALVAELALGAREIVRRRARSCRCRPAGSG